MRRSIVNSTVEMLIEVLSWTGAIGFVSAVIAGAIG